MLLLQANFQPMRIGQLAKELNRTPNDLIDYLAEHADVSEDLHPNLKLADEYVHILIDRFGKRELKTDEALEIGNPSPTIEENPKEESTSNEEENSTEEMPVAKEEESSEEEGPVEFERGQEVNPKIIEQAETVEREKITLDGPKIIDKIEVPEEVEKRKQKKEEEAKKRAEEREQRKKEREKKKFERYQKKMERERRQKEKEERRKKRQKERKAAEAKRRHYLEKVKAKDKAQPAPKPKKKKKKQKAKEEVDPLMVSEIQKREQEARKKEKNTLWGSIKRLFGM